MNRGLRIGSGIRLGGLGAFGVKGGGASDTTPPTVTITCAQTSPSATTPLNFTFTWSETVTGFAVGDITVGNGTAGNFAGSGAVYTADITPTGMSVVTVDVAQGVCVDGAGNANTAATQFTFTSTAPFSDAFTRSDGAISGLWTGATWTISSNAALNTPTAGAELVTNGNMETGNPPSSWTAGTNTTLAGVADERTGGSGAQALSVVNTGAGAGATATQQITVAAHTWLTASAWMKTDLGSHSEYVFLSSLVFSRAGTSWLSKSGAARATSANPTITFANGEGNSGQDGRWDDVTFKPLTLTQLFAYLPNVGVASVTAQVLVMVSPDQFEAGLIINLDSVSTPQNFVIAYLSSYEDTMKAYVDKCVAGTYSNVINGSVTYNSASNLKLVKNGDDYSLYYGSPGSETQVGTTQAITGMSGTIHGLFSTSNTPKFDTYQLSVSP